MKNNNLFKSIFLLVNLISTTVSSVNNSSLPLAGTNLTGLQNVSELVKRDESITLYGGTVVQGIWIDGRGRSLQRPCTLSFPAINGGGRLGFLTSYACSDSDFFAEDDGGYSIKVGMVLPPRRFDPSSGLDYRFVLVDSDYWSDLISKNVAFTEYLTKSNTTRFDLLAMTNPTQPPFTDLTVCVFGGLIKNEMACGEILEFNVTIEVPVPGTNGEEWSYFVNVVKVNMTNDYDLGYMGAPVYIPGQIPFDTQLIVAPVGQVVETLEQYEQYERTAKEKKIWYYIPIDRILQDSGVELLLGDFSDVSSSISASSPKEVPIVGKNSTSKLQTRQPEQTVVAVGMCTTLRRTNRATTRTCTLGFAVRKMRRPGDFDQGYLTLGSCVFNRAGGISFEALTENGVFFGGGNQNHYIPEEGLDYTIIKVGTNYWNAQNSMSIYIPTNDPQFVPVESDIAYPAQGNEVCFYSAYSGLNCGTISELDTMESHDNPWLRNEQGPVDYFQHVVLVHMPRTTRAQDDRAFYTIDYGAPVFEPVWNPLAPPASQQLMSIRPVGLFGQYLTKSVNFQLFGVPVVPLPLDYRYYYYIPLDYIVYNSWLELIATPQ